MKSNRTKSSIKSMATAGLAAAVFIALENPSVALGQPGPLIEQIVLPGTARDFTGAHADFGLLNPLEFGKYSSMIASTLDLSGNPVYAGAGRRVTSPWLDKDTNPISPYGDPGLVGGHFDVDVYDEAPSIAERMHEHQYDDTYDVTYVDIVNDSLLMFDNIVGASYPNDLRVEFLNGHNGGGGTYVFEADAGEIRGYTRTGFTATFTPSQLVQLRINFMTLEEMRQTEPGIAQDDAVDRDDSLSIRMFDVTTDELVYELAVYNHFKADEPYEPPVPMPATGNDACGVPLSDTVGSLANAGSGAVESSSTFREWFRDTPGQNLSVRHDLTLTANAAGVYEFATDAFFPVDGQLYGNGGGLHNDLFTYTFAADFTYRSCTDQFFDIASSDDVWVFINGELVIDLGGVGASQNQRVVLDRLGLTSGEEYELKVFYAKRRPSSSSVFGMQTNLYLVPRYAQLPTTSSLFD